jgi:hypothetical protein
VTFKFTSNKTQAGKKVMKDKLYEQFCKGKNWENYFQEMKINLFREEV